jgi:hypothetical protein
LTYVKASVYGISSNRYNAAARGYDYGDPGFYLPQAFFRKDEMIALLFARRLFKGSVFRLMATSSFGGDLFGGHGRHTPNSTVHRGRSYFSFSAKH